MQQYYGLNIDGMGAEFTASHAAALAAQLPAASRVARAEHPELAWDEATYILSHMERTLRVIAWQRTEDGQHRRNFPQHMETPADRERERRAEASATPEAMERIADRLGIPKDRR